MHKSSYPLKSESYQAFQSDESHSFWQALSLFRPYFGSLSLLSIAAVGLSFLAGITRVALTPILDIVLNVTGEEFIPSEGGESFSFDLTNMGSSVLHLVSEATGLTDTWQLLIVISMTYLFFALLGQAAGFGTRYAALKIQWRIMRDLRYRIYGHILRLPLGFLNRHQTGWFLSRVFNDIRFSTRLVRDLIVDGLSNILLSGFYLFLLIKTDGRLTIVAGVATIVQLLLSRLLMGIAARRTREGRTTEALLQGSAQERLGAVREIKALAAEEVEQEYFWKKLVAYTKAAIKYQTFKQVEGPIRASVNQFVLVTVMLFGVSELLKGNLTTSAFLLYMYFAQSLIGPLAKLAGIIVQATMIGVSLEGVSYILDQPVEDAGGKGQAIQPFTDALRLDRVSFIYEDDEDEHTVLKDIDLTIKQGEMVALVGRSGAGKTTLVDLIMRFYGPTDGSITLDSIPIEDIRLVDYRGLFGMVSQDGVIFDETVYNNIAYAHQDLTREDIESAAQTANAESFILSHLQDGYQTVLGERGVRLSGGQRQRIAIARAVANKPQILILDEATSSLDTESEQMVQEAISRVIKNSTAIVIAHRLSTIRAADRIVVLKEGRIVESGTHDELIEKDGEYRYLYDLQFKTYSKDGG